MTTDIVPFAVGASWVASAIGVALWLWSWFGARDAIAKVRFLDCGMVLLGPLFIAAGLWRLGRTACPPPGR